MSKWYVSWEYAEWLDKHSVLWHEGDTTIEAFDLRRAIFVGMWHCIDDMTDTAVAVRNFTVEEEKENA